MWTYLWFSIFTFLTTGRRVFHFRRFQLEAAGLPLEAHFILESFQRVVHDGTVAGAVDQLPHAAEDAPVAADHVGELLAAFGARVVDRTLVAVQKYAAGLLVAPQDQPLFFALHHVIGHHPRRFDVEIFGQALHITFRHFGRRHAAAVGARQAIDGVLDPLAN